MYIGLLYFNLALSSVFYSFPLSIRYSTGLEKTLFVLADFVGSSSHLYNNLYLPYNKYLKRTYNIYLNLHDINVNVCDGNWDWESGDMMAAKEQSQSVIKVSMLTGAYASMAK